MRRFTALFVVVALASLLISATTAEANHSWEGFHWSRSANPVNLTVVDSVVGEWDTYLGPSVSDWSSSSVLNLTTEAGPDSLVDRTACLPIDRKIRVCNAKYADPTWLGLATVWLESGEHIRMATAQVNDTWFDTDLYNDPVAKRHVLCQEIGHDFGLDHQYTQPSCMDDINGLFDPAFISPASHDYEQLEIDYAHLDGVTGGGGKGNKGGNGGGGNKHEHGSTGECNNGSCGSTVRVWQEGPYTVVQFVLLAPGAMTQ